MNIISQKNIVLYLNRGLASSQLSPSLLFIGQEGVGKRTTAVELAQSYCCENPTLDQKSPVRLPNCGSCLSCRKVLSHHHPDVLFIDREEQAAIVREKPGTQTAIKIESVRTADKFVHLKPLESARRTVIFDEAQKMTPEAANALLKILEEPPLNAQFILLATDERSLPSTVQSRCAILKFKPVAATFIAGWLRSEHGVFEEDALEIADQSGGSFSKALALKDEEKETLDMKKIALDDFFELLSEPRWKKEGRKQAEKVVHHLIEASLKKLEAGNLNEQKVLQALFSARRQIDRNVSPKLALENLYFHLTHSSPAQ